MNSKIIRFITLITVMILLFFIVFYPRPLKAPDFSNLLIPGMQKTQPEFSHAGLWSGCELSVYPTSATKVTSVNFLREDVEELFSPWLRSLERVLYEEAYFKTLKFEECFDALEKRYPDTDFEEDVHTGSENTFLRIGGLKEFSVPMSHADTLLIFSVVNDQPKIVLLRGGG